MRAPLLAVLTGLLLLLVAPSPVAAEVPVGPSTLSPDGRRVAEVRRRGEPGEGDDALYVDGKLRWSLAPFRRARVEALPVWSKSGDAVAFVARDAAGVGTLVVTLVTGAAAPTTLTWRLPAGTIGRSVSWLGPTRVAAGPRELEPRVIASFSATAE